MNNFMERMLPVPVNGGFRMDGYWVWCSSVMKGEDNLYHMFASRWKKSQPMHPGWLIASEIVRAVSPTPQGPYEFKEVVLPARGPQYWDGRATHNPRICKYKDTYVLYYMGTTHPFPEQKEGEVIEMDSYLMTIARANKRIGMAVSKNINGPWIRMDSPILSPRPREFDSQMVSNPSPVILEDGSVKMVYKSRAYKADLKADFLHDKMQLGFATAQCLNGPYKAQTDKALFEGSNIEVEDPFLWIEEGKYHMLAKDMNGTIVKEKHGGIYASSVDGINWDIDYKKQAYSRNIYFDDNTSRVLGNMDRPFILFEEGKATHMFFAVSDGKDGESFANCKNTWNMVIPLQN